MTVDTAYKSGKSEQDENFPVASRIVAARYRAPILAFYRFARAADDAADHPSLAADEKFAILLTLEDTLLGRSDRAADAIPLREALSANKLSVQHALDLLKAFRQDVTKKRYETWSELLNYCRYSAMPVGRFVLDVHGESPSTWKSSDALCTALQIINHLQDCGKDYKNLDRIYLPIADLVAHGAKVEDLAQTRASLPLKSCIKDVAGRTAGLLPEASMLPRYVSDTRLCVETSVIVAFAQKLLDYLTMRDPFVDPVHLSKPLAAAIAAQAAASALIRRASGGRGLNKVVKDDVA